MEQPRKIGIVTTSSMVALAILFDVISFIPIINIVAGFLAWLIFTTWFYLLGLGFANPKRMATVGASFLAEMIPFISMLPTITFGVVVIITMHNHPVATGLLSQKLPGQKGKTDATTSNNPQRKTGAEKNPPNQTRLPLNSEATRDSKPPTLAEIVPIRTIRPEAPGYAKLPDQSDTPLPQQRRLPPDISPAAPYGEEDEWDDLQKAA